MALNNLFRAVGRQICRPPSFPQFFTVQRNIMTSSAKRAEEAVEQLKSNPYFNKYADKIAALQTSSPEEFLERLEEQKNAQKKKQQETERQFSSPGMAKTSPAGSFTFSREKKLSDVMKIDLLEDKNVEEIKYIWQEYYKTKDAVVAVIPTAVYQKQHERAMEFPTFVFPLPRSKGYEFMLCQFSGHECHFTSLVNYQAYKENSPACLTLVHYQDLVDKKGIVLMRGEYDKDILNAQEAQFLTNQVQLYYSQDNEKRCNLLKLFTHNPEQFRHMDLVAELETLQL